MEFIAPCHFGLEAVLKKEITDLGYEVSSVEDGRVTFAGDENALCRANVFLRTAERVLVKVGSFHAETFEELFQGTRSIPWEEYIPEDGKFWVAKAASIKSKLFSPSDIQSIMKKAMVERLKAVYHKEWFAESGVSFPVRVFLMKDEVIVGLDTTGESLHKRGYRKLTAKAPIAENLAAALIMLTPWRGDRILVDPFCGSGTFPIEAAMIAANMAPGANRSFLAEEWSHIVPRKSWYRAMDEADAGIDRSIKPDIQGYDIDDKMVAISRENARLAGVEDMIHFQRRDVEQLSHPKKYGFLITNPPYGERLEDKNALPGLYRVLGERYQALDSWSMYVISAYEQAEQYIGRKADKNRKIYNGMMKTYYYQFMGPKPPKRQHDRKAEEKKKSRLGCEKGMVIKMQQNQLMKRTAVYTVLFACCALAVIFYYSSHKMIVVADVAQDEVTQNEASDMQNEPGQSGVSEEQGNSLGAASGQNNILFEQNGQEMSYFCIPLYTDVKAENVTIENHYMDKELWVSIKQDAEGAGYESFYQTQGVYGNRSAVIDGHFENGADTFWLKFRLTGVYEYHSILEDNKLYIEFMTPKEAYDKIVVIDPAYGGTVTGAVTDELAGKDITLEIARALKKKLDETDIKVYYTRMDDSELSDRERIELTNATKADMLIRIEVNENADSKIYGTEAVYNSQFFIPGFGSIELADLLEREVVTAISGKANGLIDSSEEDIVINEATVPAAAIRVGYVSNGQEEILLGREDYIQKIAEGIYQAILKAYED